jgi:hypothetical protein
MDKVKFFRFPVIVFLLTVAVAPGLAQKKGLAAIQAKDMVFPLRFLSAQELQGRNTPSCGLNIAARYLALNAERAGLRPLLPGGSFLQELAVEVSSVSANRSWLRLAAAQTGSPEEIKLEDFKPSAAMNYILSGSFMRRTRS